MDYFSLIKPLIYAFPPETAHHLVIRLLKLGLVPRAKVTDYPALHQKLWDIPFANPIGLGAGFDKNAECIPALQAQGFGFIEVGTVTPEPQEGNPKPRLFRLEEDEAIINRMGFNNQGMEAFWQHLKHHKTGIVGANIGKNKTTANATTDYLTLLERLYGLSDYITINISSPNTPGLRLLQERGEFDNLLMSIMQRRDELAQNFGKKIPVVVKMAPDVTWQDQEGIAEVVLTRKVDGLIISNTTVELRQNLQSPHKSETGGLSGAPLFTLSTEVLRSMYKLTKGKVPVIGVGGVQNADDAYAKIKAGASLVQIYTAFIYQGFGLVEEIKRGLAERLAADGLKNIAEAIGVDAK